MKTRSRIIAVGLAASLLAACGSGGDSGSADSSTASTRVKNAALPTTTSGVTDTTVVETTTSVVSGTTTTTVGETTTTVATTAVDTVRVKDPGNYAPTYLATTDANGAPRPALPADAAVSTNAGKNPSAGYATDADGILGVSSAQWVGSSVPLALRWTVGGVPCDNCAFLSSSAKKIVKALLAAKFVGSGITGIRGLDPTAVGLGQYQGNGWGFEVLVGDVASADAQKTGNAIRDWVLGCSGNTASTCRNVDLGIGELRWKNQIWSVADCTSALQNGGPTLLLPDASKLLKGATAETASLIRQRAAIDRVVVATPKYRPVFASTGTARALTGFASTGCEK